MNSCVKMCINNLQCTHKGLFMQHCCLKNKWLSISIEVGLLSSSKQQGRCGTGFLIYHHKGAVQILVLDPGSEVSPLSSKMKQARTSSLVLGPQKWRTIFDKDGLGHRRRTRSRIKLSSTTLLFLPSWWNMALKVCGSLCWNYATSF